MLVSSFRNDTIKSCIRKGVSPIPSVFELLFDTYGNHLMQEQAPYDEAEIQAALDRMSMPQDMQIQVCDLLSSRYLRWGTAAFAIGLGLGLSLMQDCSGRRPRI